MRNSLLKFLCLLASVVWLPLVAQLLGDDYPFYVTFERRGGWKSWELDSPVADPALIASAKLNNLGRPASEDWAGDWGLVTEGFQLSIRFATNTLRAGDPVTATLLLRNTTKHLLRYFDSAAPSEDFVFVVTRNYKPVPVVETDPHMLLKTLQGEQLRVLRPGTQHIFLARPDTFHRFADPGEYVITAKLRIPKIGGTTLLDGFRNEEAKKLTPAIGPGIDPWTDVVSGNAIIRIVAADTNSLPTNRSVPGLAPVGQADDVATDQRTMKAMFESFGGTSAIPARAEPAPPKEATPVRRPAPHAQASPAIPMAEPQQSVTNKIASPLLTTNGPPLSRSRMAVAVWITVAFLAATVLLITVIRRSRHRAASAVNSPSSAPPAGPPGSWR